MRRRGHLSQVDILAPRFQLFVGGASRFAFRLRRRAKGGRLPGPPWRSPRAPDYAALRVRCVARPDGERQNSSLRSSDMLPLLFPPALRYSPAQTGIGSVHSAICTQSQKLKEALRGDEILQIEKGWQRQKTVALSINYTWAIAHPICGKYADLQLEYLMHST